MKRKIVMLLTLAVMMSAFVGSLGLSASADFTGRYTLGQNVGGAQVFQSEDVILSVDIYGGALPAGVDLTWNEYGVFLTGTPQSLGSFSANYYVLTEGGAATITIRMTVDQQSQGITEAPVITASPLPGQINPTAAPAVYPEPKITKHPTGETVEAGGSAQFVARAEFATKLTWRLVSEDTATTYNCADASYYFPGLIVSGLGTECLTLEGIPNSMNKWCVEAKFEGPGGVAFSNGARIFVTQKVQQTNPSNQQNAAGQQPTSQTTPNPLPTKPANIYTQPVGSRLKDGESYTLSVMATSPNNGVLSYQWYSCPLNDRAAAVPIDGATQQSYTPPQSSGTMYYCVAVINTREGMISEPVYSDLVELSFEPEPTPTPVPIPTKPPQSTEGASNGYSQGSNSQIIFFGVIGFLALAALIGVLVYVRIETKRERRK